MKTALWTNEMDKETNRKGVLNTLKTYVDRRRLGELLVTREIITPQQLRAALLLQKEQKIPLGQILIRQGILSEGKLRSLLFRQWMLHMTAALIVFVTSMMAAERRARADMVAGNPPSLSLLVPVSAGTAGGYGDVSSYPALFGSQEKRSSNLRPFIKWTGVLARYERSPQTPAVKKWENSIAQFKGLPLKAMADRVNNLVNETRYIVDSRNWGQSDYWATPAEFLQKGGDCEDFAIAKYIALRLLGVPEERMRVAIVHDNQKNIPHAVLVVYTEQGSYLLDNQNKNLIDAESGSRYRPIFSINRTAWWLHTAPGAGTLIASAQ